MEASEAMIFGYMLGLGPGRVELAVQVKYSGSHRSRPGIDLPQLLVHGPGRGYSTARYQMGFMRDGCADAEEHCV